MKKEIPNFDLTDKYIPWLILIFIFIIKKTKVTFEWLVKMIISNSITSQKKDLYTKMLYNQETILI